MSIIQTIRDKATWIMLILIGVSLLGFLVQDAFVGKTGRGLFGSGTTVAGEVNGDKIETVAYEARVRQMEEQYQSMGYPMNDMMRQQVRDNAWNQMISEANIAEETDKLGLTVTTRELEDMLFGPDAPDDFKRQFTNEQGVYDVNAARNAVAQLKKQKSTVADNFNNVYLPLLLKSRLHEKFIALLGNSTYYPKWMADKMNSDNNAMASVSYVNVPYTTIMDSTVQITDADVEAYVAKHQQEFKQEASRSIAFVSFDASPSSEDSADVRKSLEQAKSEFLSTSEADMPAFLARNGSQINLADMYISKTAIQVPFKDSIIALPKGGVFGPYLDGGNYDLAKKLDEKIQPDSVKARHILIATTDRSGQQLMPDSLAKAKIDSIKGAIDRGARFDSLAAKFSDDGGSKAQGGDLGYFASGRMVKEFNDFCFEGKKGDRKIVKTQFGYHLIEIMDQKNFNPAYKIAYLSKPIIVSDATQEKASGLANQFAAESRNAKAFDDNVKKFNYNKLLAADIKPNDIVINSVGGSRALVKWIYEADKGDVSEAFPLDSKFVVATVTDIFKEGVQPASKARPLVEFIIRNQKKAEQIKKKIGSANTLEAIATATGQSVLRADSLAFASPFFPNAGAEGKVGGYAFNPDAKGKVSPPIAGNGGVYSIRTENVYARSNIGMTADQLRQSLTQNEKSAAGRGDIEKVLKNAATIKDSRSKYF